MVELPTDSLDVLIFHFENVSLSNVNPIENLFQKILSFFAPPI